MNSREFPGSEAAVVRLILATVLACALSPRALAAPAEGATQAEVIQREVDADERPLDDEVRSIDGRVAELRERVFRTKARLASLQELVTGDDAAAGARTVVRHRNEMGAAFVLEAVSYALDGAPVFAETNASGELENKPELAVFSGRVEPGHHALSVKVVYRAADAAGTVQRVKLESSYAFDAQRGKVTTVQAVGHEKRATKLEERPAVRWRTDTEPERDAADGAGATDR